MPILITADLHLSDNPRDSYRLDFMRKKLPGLLEGCSALYVLGDLTENKDFHGSWLVNTVVESFYQLAKQCKVVILKGNHDYTQESHPFYGFLKRIPNITWVNTPAVIGNHLFLPHTNRWKQEWQDIDFQQYDAIFCHQTFEGFQDSGRPLKGDVPRHALPINIRVFSGDIHTPQKIDNITYVGAPYVIDFGDGYKPRVLKLYPGKDNPAVTSIQCKWVGKQLLELDSASDLYHEGTPFDPGTILKVRIKLTAEEREHWPRIRKQVIEWAAAQGYPLWQVKPVFDAAKRTKAWKQATPENDKDTLARYGMIRKVPERTLKTGHWLMEQV